jgi:hypothetical protein
MKWILLVTWIVAGQPPSSYQAEFDTADACETARREQVENQIQMVKELDAAAKGIFSGPYYSDPGFRQLAISGWLSQHPPPLLSASCNRKG